MNEHEAPVDDPTESQLADLVRAAAAVAVPDAVRAAVAGADRPETGPQAGELWRARRPGGAVTLVWLRSLRPGGAVAVPVSFDTELAEEDTLVVSGEASPLGLPLALHFGAETAIDRPALLDRLGALPPAAVEEAVEAARSARASSTADAGRIEAADRTPGGPDVDVDEQWWPLDTLSDRADLLKAIHQALGESHAGARIAPRPAATAGSEHLSAVALVAELDAFILVAALDHSLGDAARLEAARQVLHADQLLNAVCLVEPAAPFLAVVVDRRDVVAAIETPSGELRPPRQSRPPAPVGVALSKFLDATISPFGRLARTFVEGQALDPRALAVDVSADAVRTVHNSAKGFKTEGKRPGYERVKRHQAEITRLVEAALNQPGVDVAAILDPTPAESPSGEGAEGPPDGGGPEGGP
ncbi:MAG: hypothetical protein AB1679_02675 [Actinomycetota bacterium]|jgi:hypothetical protein